jgi:hypothetical protein
MNNLSLTLKLIKHIDDFRVNFQENLHLNLRPFSKFTHVISTSCKTKWINCKIKNRNFLKLFWISCPLATDAYCWKYWLFHCIQIWITDFYKIEFVETSWRSCLFVGSFFMRGPSLKSNMTLDDIHWIA